MNEPFFNKAIESFRDEAGDLHVTMTLVTEVVLSPEWLKGRSAGEVANLCISRLVVDARSDLKDAVVHHLAKLQFIEE